MSWKVNHLPEVDKDMENLDGSQRIQVERAIAKVSQNPLPNNEGGYGKPLSGKLVGNFKIKLKASGIRIVYRLVKVETTMTVVVVGMRADDEVYIEAEQRLSKYGYI